MLSRSSICGSSTEFAHSCRDNDEDEASFGRGRVAGEAEAGEPKADTTALGELDRDGPVDVACWTGRTL